MNDQISLVYDLSFRFSILYVSQLSFQDPAQPNSSLLILAVLLPVALLGYHVAVTRANVVLRALPSTKSFFHVAFLVKASQESFQVSVIGFLILDTRKEGLERLGDFAHYLEASMEFSSR